MDLQFEYDQLHIKEEDVLKIAFRTRYRHYKYVVIPFRLTNTPSAFMDLMKSL